MIAHPAINLRKLLAATGLILLVVVVVHQISYYSPDEFAISSSLTEAIKQCSPPTLATANGNAGAAGNWTIPNVIHQIWKTTDLSTYSTDASHDSWKAMFEP